MPRRPRMCVPGVPGHVVTRGNNRQNCFYCPSNYDFYLDCLKHALKQYKVELHAYVLMTNHVHLLMTPQDKVGLSKVMQSVGRRYVQHINKRYHRSGTLWESRYKSSLVDDERYVLECYRYIELNPVRANIVQHPGDYRWSSYHFNGEGKTDYMISMHECYLNLGNIHERRESYQALLNTRLDTKLDSKIRIAAIFSKPLSDNHS